ncbi:MAG: response regulator [Chloroflexi bacterium]|nr:response regulator [Chloroflexota bacterium]
MPTILLVDDVPQIRDVVEAFLSDEGYDVRTCASAEDALAHLGQSVPDVMILDGRLPGMSGWQCLEKLRASERTARLPVLMLTAAPKDGQAYLSASGDGCTGCLVKPFDLDILLESIERVIEGCQPAPLSA